MTEQMGQVGAQLPASVRLYRPVALGVTIILGLSAAVSPFAVWESDHPAGGILGVLVVFAGAVVISRWRADVALVAVAAGPILSVVMGHDPIHSWSIACFAAFLLTLQGSSTVVVGAVVGGANFLAAGLWSRTVIPSEDPIPSIAAAAAVLMASMGSAMWANRQYFIELQRSLDASQAGREAEVKARLIEERVSIARDLHDSIGHEITVLNMHLGAAEVQLPPGSDEAASQIAQARASIQAVLRETQEILRVLRSDEPDLHTPRYERIGELIEEYRDAGMAIQADIADVELPPLVATAAYRVIQEALTNAQRHGTGAAALETVLQDDAFVIRVVNVVREHPERERRPSTSHGLAGMRERVAATGGTIDIEEAGATFTVRAVLPRGEDAQ